MTDNSPKTVVSGVVYEITEVDGGAPPHAVLQLLGWHRLAMVHAGGHSADIAGCGMTSGPDLLFKEKVGPSGKDARTWKITAHGLGFSAEAMSAFQRLGTVMVPDASIQTMSDWLGQVVGDTIGSGFADRWRARRADRAIGQSKLECGLRVIDGHEPGLSNRWVHGVAELSPGFLRFNPRGPLRSPTTVVVREVTRARQRQPRGRETWAVSAQCRIIEITTPNSTLEWAVLDRHLAWALDAIRRQAV